MTLIRAANAPPSNTLTRYIPLPVLRAAYGFILSFASPLGWVVIQLLAGRDPFAKEHYDPLLYLYMGIATAVVFSSLGYFIGRRELMITDMALTDGLTGLYNKRYFSTRLDQEFERFRRHKHPLSIIQIDLDYFKKINDTFGHQVGDEILVKVATMLKQNCRKNEIAARVGGEELCVIALDCDQHEAVQLAERLRYKVNHLNYCYQEMEIPISASFGVACADDSTHAGQEIYQRADHALYEAKRSGRNKVCLYHPA
jgi:diguanylate cyclase (GGDEF)-like protein